MEYLVENNIVKVICSDLFRYPVKSLRGVAAPALKMSAAGLHEDRRWMVVDDKGQFLSQRQLPKMATLSVVDDAQELYLRADAVFGTGRECRIERPENNGAPIEVTVWGDQCQALLAKESVNQWLTTELERPCRLVYMAPASFRGVRGFSEKGVGFADGYPLLLTSETSLQALNRRLISKGEAQISMDRFRPNLVVDKVTDLAPFAEDRWASLTLGDLRLVNAKTCGRCMVITTDQVSGRRGANREPLATLREFRTDAQGEVCFGINLVPEFINGAIEATIQPGDELEVQWR